MIELPARPGAKPKTVHDGAVDYDIAAAALGALARAGSEFLVTDPYICVGWRAGAPHSNRGGTIARGGDPVFFELGGTRARYTTPIMRTAVPGKAGPELRVLADASNTVIDALLGAIRPGVAAFEVAAVGRAATEPILDRIIFHHTYGYPVGLSFPPGWIDCPYFVLTANNPRPLEAGMVFHLPMMLRVKGQYGAGFGETIVVTEDGAECFSELPRQLAER